MNRAPRCAARSHRYHPDSGSAGLSYAEILKVFPDMDDVAWLLGYLFDTVLDGRNAHLTDGVQRALGREPRDFREYAREVAATGAWDAKPGGATA